MPRVSTGDAQKRLFKIRFIHAIQKGMTVDEMEEKFGISKHSLWVRAKKYGMRIMTRQEMRDDDLPPAEEAEEIEQED